MGLFSKKPSENAQKIIDFLGCKCEYFPAAKSAKPIRVAYEDAYGKRNLSGTIPLIVVVDDVLAEWLDILRDDEFEEGESPADYRKRLLETPMINPVKWFSDTISELKESYDEEEWNEMVGDFTEAPPNNAFSGFENFDGSAKEAVLAHIPAENPWELIAWMPFGGWNDCPEPVTMLSVAKYWYERYRAVPAVISHDTLEFSAQPLPDDGAAAAAALEQYAFCADVVEQGFEKVGLLAGSLLKSTVWYFWWD